MVSSSSSVVWSLVTILLLTVSQVPLASSQQLNSVLQTLQGSLGNLRNSGIGRSLGVGGGGDEAGGSPPRGHLNDLEWDHFSFFGDNAAIVNEAFRGMPIPRTTFLAIGDEFPKLRDDFITKTRSGGTQSGLQRALSVATNLQNWQYDRENNKKELSDPFIRPSRQFLTSLLGSFGGGSGGGSSQPNPNRFRISLDTVAASSSSPSGTADDTEKEQSKE